MTPAAARGAGPALWSDRHRGWVITRYADVSAILHDPHALPLDVLPGLAALAARGGPDLAGLEAFCRSLSLLARPPRHQQTRRLLSRTLGGTRTLDLPQLVADRAGELLDRGAATGTIDLAEDYARALALFVVGAFLGIEPDDLTWLGARSRDLVRVFDSTLPSLRVLREMDDAARSMMAHFLAAIGRRRAQPTGDGLSRMIDLADGDRTSDVDLAGYCTFFFMAAAETSAAAIGEAARLILSSGELRAMLVGRPDLVPVAARECVRLASPVRHVVRQLDREVQLGDTNIPAGQPLFLMLGTANQDPAVFPDPDHVKLDRVGPASLDFAAGPYRCIGRALAMLELETAIRALVDRPQLTLSDDPPLHLPRANVAPLIRLVAKFR